MSSFIDWLFDEHYYLQKHADVRAAGVDARQHYDSSGAREGRVPNAGLEIIEVPLLDRAGMSDNPLNDIVDLFPSIYHRDLVKPYLWQRIKDVLHPGLYVAQTGDEKHTDLDQAFNHYLATGAFDGLRPSALFNTSWYLEELRDRMQEVDDPEVLDIEAGVHPFFHWITIGWDNRIVPTPLFDDEYYERSHPDVSNLNDWPFLHYLIHGCFEGSRRPSSHIAEFDHPDPAATAGHNPLLLKLLLESDSATPGAWPIGVPSLPDAAKSGSGSFPLESTIAHIARKARKLRSPIYRELVAKAAAIEPLVMHPYMPKEIIWLPYRHGNSVLAQRCEAFRHDVGISSADIIVLVPHCRMAGSARAAGELTRSLRQVYPSSRMLLLTTDLEDFERPDWFDNGTSVFDVSKYAGGLVHEHQVRLLLDIVRGLAPGRVFNVDSQMGWELFRLYGKQLAKTIDLFAHLFTWDLDERGNKGGYPITYFQSCFGFLKGVFVDNAALREELVWRYALSTPLREKLHLAHTPSDFVTIDHSVNFERRRAEGRKLRTFWVGRFNRQKRFDIVVDIAKMMPELQIWAWGKEDVLGGSGVDFGMLPPNIRLQGTYDGFDDLPVESCDFMLYTSEWDGLPTILIDAAMRGVPTVASGVGGVNDLISSRTGFPVTDALNASAYKGVIEAMMASPDEVTSRAKALRDKAHSLFSRESHVRTIRSATLRSHESMSVEAHEFKTPDTQGLGVEATP